MTNQSISDNFSEAPFIAAMDEIKKNDVAWAEFLKALKDFNENIVCDASMSANDIYNSIAAEYDDNTDIEVIVGHSGFYPMPEYGWDGGSPIRTCSFNIKILSTSSIGGGPTANLVNLQDSTYPGLSIHSTMDGEFFVVVYKN